MSNGFGAAFGGLLLLAVLSGLAALLGLCLAGMVVSRRRTGTVPDGLRYLSAAAVLGVLLVTGFAVAALFDEAATLAAVFVASVLIPLGAVGLSLQRGADLGPLDVVATAGVAWSVPFLVGLAVTFAVPPVVTGVVTLAPGEAQQLGLYWLAAALGGVVVALGAVRLSTPVRGVVAARPTR